VLFSKNPPARPLAASLELARGRVSVRGEYHHVVPVVRLKRSLLSDDGFLLDYAETEETIGAGGVSETTAHRFRLSVSFLVCALVLFFFLEEVSFPV